LAKFEAALDNEIRFFFYFQLYWVVST